MEATLYERLGGTEGITRIVSDEVDLHAANPRIATRFAASDLKALKETATAFVITGTGGPACYEGQDMVTAHKGMNIDADEFLAVIDDALEALQKNNVGQREQEEVLYILFSMKNDIVFV